MHYRTRCNFSFYFLLFLIIKWFTYGKKDKKNIKLEDIFDISVFQKLPDDLDQIYPFPRAIIDNDGEILTATARQDLCTKFHRANPDCEKECI